jgi:anti-sigma B factor antagonist
VQLLAVHGGPRALGSVAQLLFTVDPMSNLEPQTFSVRVLPGTAALILEVEGEVDMLTAPALLKAIDEVPEGTSCVVVDLTMVSFLDSSGLNTLVQGRRALDAREVAMRVVVPPDGAIRRVFEITRLTETLTVVDTRESALP